MLWNVFSLILTLSSAKDRRNTDSVHIDKCPVSFADFSSSTGDDLSRPEFVKDLGSAMSGSFDSDLFPSDETLREGLDPIDFDGLQMLTDPDMNVITDPETEDNFRLDRL